MSFTFQPVNGKEKSFDNAYHLWIYYLKTSSDAKRIREQYKNRKPKQEAQPESEMVLTELDGGISAIKGNERE
jgi:hypothetical protein